MRFDIILAPEAVEDFKALKANVRSTVRDALERHLRHEPRSTSRSSVKRLRGLGRPQYRLRVDEVRVFMMYPARPSAFWRSCPNRRLSHGWLNTEVRSKAGATLGGEGRPFSFPARGGKAGHRHHTPRQAGWRPDRIRVGGRLVRIPARNRPAFPSPDSEGAQEPACGPRRT